MTSLLDKAVEEIKAALPPLPEGFFVRKDSDATSIVIGNEVLGFAVTYNSVADNLHINQVKHAFPFLLKCLAQWHALMAACYDKEMLFSIAKSVRVDGNADTKLDETIKRLGLSRRGPRIEPNGPEASQKQ